MPDTHRLAPGATIDLSKAPTRADGFHDDKNTARQEFRDLRDELVEWQRRLYAEGERKLLIVLQAMDAGGKDSTIRKVFGPLNPQGVRVHPFKSPTARELALLRRRFPSSHFEQNHAHEKPWNSRMSRPAAGVFDRDGGRARRQSAGTDRER